MRYFNLLGFLVAGFIHVAMWFDQGKVIFFDYGLKYVSYLGWDDHLYVVLMWITALAAAAFLWAFVKNK